MPEWRNWSGYLKSNPQQRLAPRDVAELQSLVRSAPGPVRVAGSGHSFTPLLPTDGTMVSLDNIAGLIRHDPASRTATIGGGTKLGDLTEILHGIDQALANMGDIDKQSIGGALGTATHGTGATLGAYHTLVEEVELVDGRGDLRTYNRTDHREMLEAICVTLGAFGIFTKVTLRNLAPYRLRKQRHVLPIRDMLANFQSMMTAHRSAEFFFIPFSNCAMFLGSDISDKSVTVRPPEDDEDGLKTLKLLGTLLGWFPWARRRLIEGAVRKFPREDFVEDWLKVYTSERKTRFNEMEYHLPAEEAPKALTELIALMEGRFPEVYFPLEVRLVAADDFWLSPFYKRQSCSIAVHHDATMDPLPFLKAVEPIFRKYGGRPHWGKMHTLRAEELKALYPRWDDAIRVRRDIDPDGRFVTPYIASLLGIL